MTGSIFRNPDEGPKTILLHTQTGKAHFTPDSIMRIEAISNYSKLYFTDGKTLVVAKVLHWFEENLTGDGFARVHKSHLVNTFYIQNYNSCGVQTVRLTDNSSVQVARRKQTEIKRLLLQKISA